MIPQGKQKIVGGDDAFTLTYGRVSDGRKLAIISTGGHPQRPGSGECTVLDFEVCKTLSDAKKWYREAIVNRPWETRQ